MKKLIRTVIDKMVERGWITLNEHIVPEAIDAAIAEAMRDISVRDFLNAFYD